MRIRVFLPLVLASVAGCREPEVDDFRHSGGTAPDPTGVIEGTVLYVGPRPACRRDDAGAPTGVVGRVVLTLFHYDNPPPPTGGATSAANLLTIPGPQLFTDLEGDCMPTDAMDERADDVITRAASFIWPDIELHVEAASEFQIRGFFDYDEDFNPFFTVRNLPTRGDVAGGAFNNTFDVPPVFFRIRFGSQDDAPRGEVVSGVAVTLGARVMTERPMSYLDPATLPLSSEATIPRVTDSATRESMLFAQTNMRLRLYRSDATFAATREDGTTFEPRPLTDALERAGVGLDFAPEGYAYFVDDVDANGDGERDLHPILGSAGIFWQTPIVIFRRFRDPTSIEVAAGVPDVLLIASVRPTQTLFTQVFRESIEIVAPPVAAVQLGPSPICRVPYITPDTFAETYERVAVDCQEVPTGFYAVNVIHGNAGGAIVDSPVSETGKDFMGGALSGQAWTIPNQLGDAVQLGDPSLAVPEQGLPGTFLVNDPNPGTFLSRRSGTPGCMTAVSGDPMAMGATRPIAYMPLSAEQEALDCCGPFEHLCNVPVCPAIEVRWHGGTHQVRGQPTEIVGTGDNGRPIPNCVPFELPMVCCPAASPAG